MSLNIDLNNLTNDGILFNTFNNGTKIISVANGNLPNQAFAVYGEGRTEINTYSSTKAFKVTGYDGTSVSENFVINGDGRTYIATNSSYDKTKMFSIDNNGYTKSTFEILGDGTTYIGQGRPTTTYANAKLTVDGLIIAKEVKVSIHNSVWADYVFEKNYDLKPLCEVEKYITENKHLNGIPSASEVKENGIDVVEMNAKLLEKIEELYLYTIKLEKDVETLKKQVN